MITFSKQICSYCGSNIYGYLKDGKLVFECSYCGKSPENEPDYFYNDESEDDYEECRKEKNL